MHSKYTTAMEPALMRALDLAARGMYGTPPNPRVGCAIYRDNMCIGEGWHEQAGQPHAEVMAVQTAKKNSEGDLQGAQVYLSLEPCAHHGRTPPCADMLSATNPALLIAAMPDPNPQVAGCGFAKLREAGIPCIVAPPHSLPWQRAQEQNIGFISRMIRKRPWLRLKIAATADGKTALDSGLSQWITNEQSRTDVHKIRARSCAIITGIGTARVDNPQLTVRHINTVHNRQPLRILIDRDLSASPTLTMLQNNALIATAVNDSTIDSKSHQNADIISLPNAEGKVDLCALLNHLAEREVNEVTVEAGRRLCGAFVQAGLVDEIVLYQSSAFFGNGMAMIDMPSPSSVAQATKFCRTSCTPIGDDLKMVFVNPHSQSVIDDALQTLYEKVTTP